MGKLIGMILIAAFWNGIVSVFLWQIVLSFRRGDPEWFLCLFMTPFVLVGLGLMAGVVYFLLALANPRPQSDHLARGPASRRPDCASSGCSADDTSG